MPIDTDAVQPHVAVFSEKLSEFPGLKKTLETFQQPEQWREIVATFLHYGLLLKKLARLGREKTELISELNYDLKQKGASDLLDALSPENRQKLITTLTDITDPRSPLYTAALTDLRSMMHNGQEIFDAGQKPRDGDPKSDGAIWGFTQIAPEHTKAQMHFVVCHFLERYTARSLQAAGVALASHKDFLLHALEDVLLIEHTQKNTFQEIFALWTTPKKEGGLGWINQEKRTHYQNIIHQRKERNENLQLGKITELSYEDRVHLSVYHGKVENEGINIDIEYYLEDTKIIARPTINKAQKKGDEAMRLLAQEFQQVANEYGVPVVHNGLPTNQGMENLFARTEGYQSMGRDEQAWLSFWEKTFYPAEKF